MTAWSDDELARIGAAEELQSAPRRADGSTVAPTTIWVVRAGDELFVRSYRGRDGGWFTQALPTHEARIRAAGVERDVQLTEPGPSVRGAVDEAYRTKYDHYRTYVEPMIADAAAAATFRLTPR